MDSLVVASASIWVHSLIYGTPVLQTVTQVSALNTLGMRAQFCSNRCLGTDRSSGPQRLGSLASHATDGYRTKVHDVFTAIEEWGAIPNFHRTRITTQSKLVAVVVEMVLACKPRCLSRCRLVLLLRPQQQHRLGPGLRFGATTVGPIR